MIIKVANQRTTPAGVNQTEAGMDFPEGVCTAEYGPLGPEIYTNAELMSDASQNGPSGHDLMILLD